MPIFTYICKKCGNKFDILEGVNQEVQKKVCTKCSGKDIERVFTGFNVGLSSSGRSPFCVQGTTCPSSGTGMCGGCPGTL